MRTNLTKAFAELRKNGYFAKQNFLCCQSCGWAALSDEEAKNAVFEQIKSGSIDISGSSGCTIVTSNGVDVMIVVCLCFVCMYMYVYLFVNINISYSFLYS